MRLSLFLPIICVCSIRFTLAAPLALAQSDQPLPKEVLVKLYEDALGDRWKAELFEPLAAAHELLEKYFASSSKGQRDDIIGQLDAMQIDPNLLGRISRIRLFWPQLKPGVYYVNEKVGPFPVIYFVGVPEGYDRTRPVPLVIRLPDVHIFITNPRPTPEQVADAYTGWIRDELKAHPDAVILMPMLNTDELWGPSQPGMNLAIQPLQHVQGRINIDPRRIYLVGHSMPAAATWTLALHYPTYFAAINPLAGGAPATFQKLRLPNLCNTFTVVWHDANDTIIKPEYSRELVKLLKIYKYDVEYEETKDLGHAPPADLVERQYQKMRTRTRDLYPKQVVLASNRPEAMFNRADWVQEYQMLNAGPDEKLRIVRGSGNITIYRNAYTIDARLAGDNKIVVKTENVESMRLLLNDQMVDLKKPVTVTINGKVRFQGTVEPSVRTMLADQIFLGRGWRYFTAVADIDFSTPTTRPTTRPATRPR